MRISNGRVVWSATDLKKAAECEFAWVRNIDAKLGRIAAVVEPVDEMMQRAITLGLSHERAVLERYRAEFGEGVVELATVGPGDSNAMAEAIAATEAALSSDAKVLYQAAFAHDDFIGFADFMVRTDAGWLVQDTKLARTARVTALMQLAAYVEQLQRLGAQVDPNVELLLGNGETSTHALDDIMPVYRLRRDRIRQLIQDRAITQEREPIAWNDERGDLTVTACGRCATCEGEVVAHRDLLLVAGMRPVHRRLLRAAGIDTIDQLGIAGMSPAGMNPDVFASLRLQAQLQLRSPAGVPDPSAPIIEHPVPEYEVVMAPALSSMPRPNAGDIYFDFEGDPLHTEGDATQWGLDYLFGWVDNAENYSALWAHSFEEEKAALRTFLDTVAAIRRTHPGMHIYHYAPYETSHLTAMAARYGTGEAEVDNLLRDGVFVDLYPIVKRAVRVGSRSYSIKKLEPLYMGDEVRVEEVQNGGDSIGRYVQARILASDGHSTESGAILQDLANYNKYDCVSTHRLRNWLIQRAIDAGRPPAPEEEPEERQYQASPLSTALLGIAIDETQPEHARSLRLAAAAIDYYPRESKTFWSEHFLRLREVLPVWESQRNVMAVDQSSSVVVEDWSIPDGAYTMRRTIELRGELSPGSTLKPGSEPFAVYERPVPFKPKRLSQRWLNVAHPVKIIAEMPDGSGYTVEEKALDGQTWDDLPIALTAPSPPDANAQQRAIDEWAQKLISHEASSSEFRDPAWDLLMRNTPRTAGPIAVDGGVIAHQNKIDAIVAAVASLDNSYVAVQGPPGTGKTYVAAHVIEKLIRERHYRIGVVAQSHAVVDNVLDKVIAAGVPAERVGKSSATLAAEGATFTRVLKRKVGDFIEKNSAGGFVIGGTAWDFANPQRIARKSLDLLVIDEAGQYSLASSIACSVAANRLLLLGDPQQLPQVSQGTHPEPVDVSALGWLMDEADVIPSELGFFLEHSWRMHPLLAESVSRLSYGGKLAAHESASERSIDAVNPGVHPIPLPHRGNSSHSTEEADEVVRIARDLIGRTWNPGEGEQPRPLAQDDIIVVTPYNAQQQTVADALLEARLEGIRVGTVDKFQGQEAAVSIVSLAASTAREAPRGVEFLLLENRINVAISRAQCAAYVIYSPWLLDDLPFTPAGVRRLSAFARLVALSSESPLIAGAKVSPK